MQANILVVDDEKEIADLVQVYLENEGFTVYKCYTGKEALRIIEEKDLDLALLDVMLPEMDGFSLCRIIRQKHTWPVIRQRGRDGQNQRPEPGGRRLYHKALQPFGDGGPGEGAVAPGQAV